MPINPKFRNRIENYKKKLHFSFHPFLFESFVVQMYIWKMENCMDTKNIYNVERKVHNFMLEAYKKEKDESCIIDIKAQANITLCVGICNNSQDKDRIMYIKQCIIKDS